MTQGFLLILSSSRRQLFKEYVSVYGNFAEPVPSFPFNRNYPYLVFVVAEDNRITHIASGKGGVTAGSGMRRINVDKVKKLTNGFSFKDILKNCSRHQAASVKKSLTNGGTIPPESFREIIRSIIKIDAHLEALIDLYLAKRHFFERWNPKLKQALADQKEAVSTALQLSDIDRSPLQTWTAIGNERPSNFLEGLSQVYLREDQMINADLLIVPGFDLMRISSYSSARFSNDASGVILDVMVANRTLIEEQTGADLIYYNELYRSFVLVQYKAMEREAGTGAIFRLPDKQLQKEIGSMEALLKQLGDNRINNHSDYRFTYNPFFIKLCPRIIFDPNDIKLTAGMYFNLDHWKILNQDKNLQGSRAGQAITFENIGRHITNTDFVVLVKHSWIGTTPVQSEILEKLIHEILESGKSLVYAVKRNKRLITDNNQNGFENGLNEDLNDLPF